LPNRYLALCLNNISGTQWSGWGAEGQRAAVAWSALLDLKVFVATHWDCAALAVLHLALVHKVSAFDSRPCLGALCVVQLRLSNSRPWLALSFRACVTAC
jgi:hypothetical protein